MSHRDAGTASLGAKLVRERHRITVIRAIPPRNPASDGEQDRRHPVIGPHRIVCERPATPPDKEEETEAA